MKSIFSTPKVVKYDDLTKPWFVYFRYDKKLFRYKFGINYIQNYRERLIEANAIRDALHQKLKDNWNPNIPDVIQQQSELNLTEALDFAIEKKTPNIGTKTLSGYNGTIKFIKAAVKSIDMDCLPIVDTKRVHIKLIMEKAKEQRKWTNNAYNKHLNHLKAILSELIQWDIIPINPANNIKNLPVSESRANIPATPQQHKIIKEHLQSLHSDFCNFIVTIFHTGIRPEEILKIQLGMIDVYRFQIILPPEITKTNKERIVPINKHLFEVYKSMNFENLPKEYYLFGATNTNHKYRALRKEDFIPGPNKMKRDTATRRWETIVKKGLGYKEVNMYSNKHAGANAKILAGMDLDALRELYGHTSKLMTTKYATVVKEVYRKQIMENSPDF